MLKGQTAKLSRGFKTRSKEERAFFFMGGISEVLRLEKLFRNSNHKDGPLLADMCLFRASIIRKQLRKV